MSPDRPAPSGVVDDPPSAHGDGDGARPTRPQFGTAGRGTAAPLDEADLAARVHRRLLAPGAGVAPSAAAVAALVRAEAPLAPSSLVARVTERVRHRTGGLGPLEVLLADPEVSEVMVNGPGPVWVERAGRLERTDVVVDLEAIRLAVERVVGPLGLRADPTHPLVDARLPDGSRVNVAVPPLAVDGPCVTIRRFRARQVPLADLCPPGVAEVLAWAVDARCNVVACGGTGAGKTTLLNALGAAIPAGQRIVTVEDAAELRLPGDHVVRLESRPATADGATAVPIRALVRNALRMRPDRIVVGECRAGEALDMLQAMNTGHEGSLTTCHANGTADALRRLETMVLLADVGLPLDAVRQQLAAAVDLVVLVARQDGGARRVVAVAEVEPPGGAGGTLGVRQLAGPDGLHRLPERPARRGGAPAPDPAWCRGVA